MSQPKETYLVLRVAGSSPSEIFLTTEDGTIINGVQSVTWETDINNISTPLCTIRLKGVGMYALPGLPKSVEPMTPEEAKARAIELLGLEIERINDRS